MVAAMGPGLRQVGAPIGIGQEHQRDDRHDQAGRPPRRLQDEDDERDADDDVHAFGQDRALAEIRALRNDIGDDREAQRGEDIVPDVNAVAKPVRRRKQQEDQEQDQPDMDRPEDIGRYDRPGGVEVEQRDGGRQQRERKAEPPRQLVGAALFLFDIALRFVEPVGRRFLAGRRLCGRVRHHG
jgi:hypothetical protein